VWGWLVGLQDGLESILEEKGSCKGVGRGEPFEISFCEIGKERIYWNSSEP